MRNRLRGFLAPVLVLAACGDGTGPDERFYALTREGGHEQVGAAGQRLPEPFVVRVTDGGEPAANVTVRWEPVPGSGATVSSASVRTDTAGLAETFLTLGPNSGTYAVTAQVPNSTGTPLEFTARAVLPPEIASVTPAQAAAGEEITITGENFSPVAAENVVLFDGFRGEVLSASETEIRARVAMCIPTRTAELTIRIGPIESQPIALDVIGSDEPPLSLDVGEVVTLSDPSDLACVRLPGGESNARFLAVPQNASPLEGRTLPFHFVGVAGESDPVVTMLDAASGSRAASLQLGSSGPAALEWEARLRARERAIPRDAYIQPGPAPRFRTLAVPTVGSREDFYVYNKDDGFTRIDAEVMYVGERAVIYQDLDAPSGGFTNADFEYFSSIFDDPIFPTVTGVFGDALTDLDVNERVIILFTPVVNELTPEGSPGFVAGFFFAHDFTNADNSNRGEIFYSLVPDPDGDHGDPRTRQVIRRAVPPVLAHEFQHMVHHVEKVRERNGDPEILWLSEGLAHMAEDVVADAFEARGEVDVARDFRNSNNARAFRYLDDPWAHSLIDNESPGTLEERGAHWLFVKYLATQFGNDILADLTQTALIGVANVEAAAGTDWEVLFSRWSVALWADDAPDLVGAELDPAYTFPGFDLRQAMDDYDEGAYPLAPASYAYTDFRVEGTLPVSSPLYVLLEAPVLSPPPLSLNFSRRGDDFLPTETPRWSILRIR